MKGGTFPKRKKNEQESNFSIFKEELLHTEINRYINLLQYVHNIT